MKRDKHSEKLQVLPEHPQSHGKGISGSDCSLCISTRKFSHSFLPHATQTLLSAPSQQPLNVRATPRELWEEVETASRIRVQGCHDELLPLLLPHPWADVQVLPYLHIGSLTTKE